MTETTSGSGQPAPTAPRRRAFSLRDVGRALRNPAYRVYAAGNVVSLVGTWVQRVALGWLTWELTESATWLGIIGFADLIPGLLVAPFAGLVADRLNRLRLMLLTQAMALSQAALLAVLTFTDLITIEWLLGLTIYLGIAVGFTQPARLSLIPSLVRREDLSAATAFNSIMFNTARFLGPAIAGVVIVWGGAGTAFAINAVSYLALIVALASLRLLAEDTGEPADRGFLADITAGFRYAAAHPAIGPLLVLVAVVALFARPFTELLPGFASDVFGRGASGLAWLHAMIGLGAMAGGMWLAQRQGTQGLTRLVTANAAVFAVALLAFTATDDFRIALPAIAAAGFSMIAATIGALTLIQLAVEGTMRGRVMSIYGMVFRGGMATGALLMGAASSTFGLRETVAGGAVISLVIGLVLAGRLLRRATALDRD